MEAFKGSRRTALLILNISGIWMCVVSITFLLLNIIVFSNEKSSSLVDVN